jgi:hypothetical protein
MCAWVCVCRDAVEEPGPVQQVEPGGAHGQVEHAHAGHPRRDGLPAAGDRGPERLHRPPAAQHPLQAPRLPHGEPLGPQAPEQVPTVLTFSPSPASLTHIYICFMCCVCVCVCSIMWYDNVLEWLDQWLKQ